MRNGILTWKNKFGLALALFMLMSANALANRLVIDELRKLRSSLSLTDPSRKELSLRLADRLAEEALIGKDKASPADSDRKEAISLYQEVLPLMAGNTKVKIQFQLARLYAEKTGDLASVTQAKNLFQQVVDTAQDKSLKRESVLRLAEIAEADPKTSAAAPAYYRQVLALCEGTDSCSFSHYRLAWILRNQDQMPEALAEMKEALWDSKGQIREEALRDLVSFMGLTPNRFETDVTFIESLAQKVNRPTLLQDLAYAYFTSGNRSDGVKVLALTHSRAPTLDSSIRLLEEYYGLRNWDSFRSILTQFVESSKKEGARQGLKDAIESEKICRRLATQLDGERTSDINHFEDFRGFTLSYLELFPQSLERAKIMEGYVVADPVVQSKIDTLAYWLNTAKFGLPVADQINLRELRAAIAQKEASKNEKMNEVVRDEMTALLAFEATDAKVKAKSRDYHYARARANYALKDFEKAIPEFKELAVIDATGADNYAIQSQHLILDVFNQQKNYAQIIEQAASWTENASLQKNTKIEKDLNEMKSIASQAKFEKAISAGSTAEALATFARYCVQGEFLPKSCDNAKVLSITLAEHVQLIGVLEAQAARSPAVNAELAAEYENGAYFEKAANLSQKLAASSAQFKEQVKVALLYELARHNSARDAVIRDLSQKVIAKKMTLTALEERAFISMVSDAGLLDSKMMKVASNREAKLRVAESLEEAKRGDAETKALLLSESSFQGNSWSKLVIAAADSLSKEVLKQKFYGRNGQVLFQKRVNRLKDLNAFAEKYLSGGADLATRVRILQLLKQNYDAIQSEILNSPLPAGLNEDQLAQVKTGLSEMAKPFSEKTLALQALLDSEKLKALTPEEKLLFSQEAVEGSMTLGMSQSSAVATPVFDEKAYDQAVLSLHKNPKDPAALQVLKTVFTQAGQGRVAAYFDGRLKTLGGVQP